MNSANLKELFFQKKPAEQLLLLLKQEKEKNTKESYASILAKKTDCTYTHVLAILAEMGKFGLITTVKEGRINRIQLTTRGRAIGNALKEFELKLLN